MKAAFKNPVDGIILGITALLMHQTSFVCYRDLVLAPGRGCQYGSAGGQLGALMTLVIILIWLLKMRGETGVFQQAWRRNWPVAIFVALAIVSLGWTTQFGATLYRSLLVLFSTLIAAYLGIRMTARHLAVFLAILIGVFGLASLILVLLRPDIGIMTNYPYEGLWRGIFWHKIYLGATMALGYIVYLVILLSPVREFGWASKIAAGILLVIVTAVAVFSDSASGLVVFAIQSGLVVLWAAWRLWGHKIPRRGYWILGLSACAALALVLSNLGFFFGLFNRSANMTGRVPMWVHVWETYVMERPVFGHGFGAFWLQTGINEEIQSVVRWPYPVRVADNGYIDVLLGLGFPGLILLLVILGMAFSRWIPSALHHRSWTALFPTLVLVHILFINISLSYFIEIESFIWFLLVLVLFMSVRGENPPAG